MLTTCLACGENHVVGSSEVMLRSLTSEGKPPIDSLPGNSLPSLDATSFEQKLNDWKRFKALVFCVRIPMSLFAGLDVKKPPAP